MFIRNYIVLRLGILYSICNGMLCTTVYKLLTSKVTYSIAESMCAAEGMQLATFRDTTTANEMTAFLNAASLPGEMWIGIYWDSTTLMFRWADNDAVVIEPLPYGWTFDEPTCMTSSTAPCSTGWGQDCIRLKTSYKIATIMCDFTYYPLCQSKTLSYSTTNEPDNSYTTSDPCPVCEAPTGVSSTCEPCATTEPDNSQTTCDPCPVCEAPTGVSSTCEPCTTKEPDNSQSTCDPCPVCETSPTPTVGFTSVEPCTCSPCECTVDSVGQQTNLTIGTTKPFSSDALYRVDKKKTSMYQRLHHSAHDDRFSARMLGYTGVMILITFALVFVIFDLMNFTKYRHQAGQIRKKVNKL